MIRQRYQFNNHNATKGKIGSLYSPGWWHVISGDTWSGQIHSLFRFSPLIKPILLDFNIDSYLFYCPLRILDDKFIPYKLRKDNTTVESLDKININQDSRALVGFPHKDATQVYLNAHVPLAYQEVWNNYFRVSEDDERHIKSTANIDNSEITSYNEIGEYGWPIQFGNGIYSKLHKDLIDVAEISTVEVGPKTRTTILIQDEECYRTWQRGTDLANRIDRETFNVSEFVVKHGLLVFFNENPPAGYAKITTGVPQINDISHSLSSPPINVITKLNGQLPGASAGVTVKDAGYRVGLVTAIQGFCNQGDTDWALQDVTGEFIEDLGEGSKITINELREAYAKDRLLRREQRFDVDDPDDFTAYRNLLMSRGIKVDSDRLDQPELLTRARVSPTIHDVVDSGSAANNVGKTAGYALQTTTLNLKRKYFQEDGILLMVTCMRPHIISKGYMADRMLQPRDGDFFDEANLGIGFQDVKGSDIISPEDSNYETSKNSIIGYQPKYQHFRQLPNKAHTSLSSTWIPEIKPNNYDTLRKVNQNNFDQIFADTTDGHFQHSAVIRLRANRPVIKSNRTEPNRLVG